MLLIPSGLLDFELFMRNLKPISALHPKGEAEAELEKLICTKTIRL